MATSSAPISRTVPPAPAAAPAASSPPPNPPTMMFMTERFIASAMSLVRIAPEAPTRAPEMISTGLPSTNPAIAAAVPVNEFRRLMTTGMSAPPIGSTIVIPKIRPDRTTRPRRTSVVSLLSVIAPAAPAMSATVPSTATTARATVMNRAAGQEDRLARDQALELAARDQRAGEGDRADERAEHDEDRRVDGRRRWTGG